MRNDPPSDGVVATENGGQFYNLDCISGSREHLADSSVDLIVTDPPYGIDGDKLHQHYNRKEEFVVEGYVEVPRAQYNSFSHAWIKEAERVLKPGGSLYIVSGYTNLYDILDALRATKLREINHLIWKYNFGVFTSTKYVSSHYHILFYEKPGGKRTFNLESRFGLAEKDANNGSLNYQDREDVWLIPREYKPGEVKNKNELPTALLTKILQYSSNQGDLVADFFLGGFSTAKVAIGLGRRAVGFELSERSFRHHVAEIADIERGHLLASLRTPTIVPVENSGREWTATELQALHERFVTLIGAGATKKAASEALQREFKRGKWSVEKALKRRPPTPVPTPVKKDRVSSLERFL